MTRRYFSEAPIASAAATLDGPEAHHLLHVLRATAGTAVTLFDGSGAEFEAEVIACRRSSVELRVLHRRQVDRELPFSLTLGVPLPKGDRQRWIVEKAVELGVTRLVPLVTQRSAAASEKHSASKLRRYVIEASKQCGRNRLMEIATPAEWADWLRLAERSADGRLRKWIAHPGRPPLLAAEVGGAKPSYVAVGPEGGLADEEIAAAEAEGWTMIGLGPRILRIETAAFGLVAMLALPR
ncbi:MAG: RNA methyltransferase RsmE [Planctomycetota bacterium]|nr:MAG: RNA methyltransferase RsmE [Planctomycetota bacterium]